MKSLIYKCIAGFCRMYGMLARRPENRINTDSIKRILIIFTHGIGDMCMFMPALDVLFRNFSRAKIDILVTKSALTVLNNQYAFNKIGFLNLQNSLNDQKKIIHEFRKEKYDLSIVGVVSPGIEDAAWLSAGIRARYRIGPKNRPIYTHTYTIKEGVHDVLQNVGVLKEFFNFNSSFRAVPRINISLAQKYEGLKEMGVGQDEKCVIGIHPGGLEVDQYKRWPEDKFARLADQLIEARSAKVVIFEGPDEFLLGDKIVKMMKNKAVVIRGKPLKSVMEMIKACHLFISSDSGLGHIAAALQVPVMAIFGPADPRRASPFGNKVWIARRDLPCSPCYHKSGYCTQPRRYCLEDITPEDIFNRISKILNSNKGDDHESHVSQLRTS